MSDVDMDEIILAHSELTERQMIVHVYNFVRSLELTMNSAQSNPTARAMLKMFGLPG